jgi:hypothetical protein
MPPQFNPQPFPAEVDDEELERRNSQWDPDTDKCTAILCHVDFSPTLNLDPLVSLILLPLNPKLTMSIVQRIQIHLLPLQLSSRRPNP